MFCLVAGGGRMCPRLPADKAMAELIGLGADGSTEDTAVDPPQQAVGAIKSLEFEPLSISDDGAFILSSEWDLLLLTCPIARMEWLQELHHDADASSQIGECDILLLCPDAGNGMHGGQRTLAI
jgi:hypothetical protein